MAQVNLAQIQAEMEAVVYHLYNLMTRIHKGDGDTTIDASKRDAKALIQRLLSLSRSAPNLAIDIPYDIIMYVQEGRNPEIYTREFVEAVMRNNQLLKGKQEAFTSFRDILAREIAGAIPEMRNDVKAVVERTGGLFED